MDSRLLVLLATVFVSLIGVGIVVPLFPFFGARVGAGPELITFMIAVFALGQFLAAPVWGRISDSIGRKPVLVISLLGAVGSYVILAYAETIEMLMLSRLIGGLMAGNIAVALAAITDITPPEGRTKAIGQFGAASAMGFILGPAIGGLLAGTESETANFFLVAAVAAGMNGLAVLSALLVFKETHNTDNQSEEVTSDGRQSTYKLLTSNRTFLRLLAVNFLFFGAAAMFESSFALLANMRHGFGPSEVGYTFTLLGTVTAVIQLAAIGPLVRWFGDRTMLRVAMAFYAIGLVGLGVAENLWVLFPAMILCAMGTAIFLPTSNSLAAQLTDPQNRGVVLGAFQAAGNLGRAIPPFFSGVLFAQLGMGVPFYVGAASIAVAFALILLTKPAPTAKEPKPVEG